MRGILPARESGSLLTHDQNRPRLNPCGILSPCPEWRNWQTRREQFLSVQMNRSTLHSHVRDSVRGTVASRYKNGFRFVLESGSAEGFLRDLLAIDLQTRGYNLSREFQSGPHKVDLVLHQDEPTYIEVKQLHLKDRARYVKNVASDLKRHTRRQCLGVVYLLDERQSLSKLERPPFRNRNRKASCEVSEIITVMRRAFHVYPNNEQRARVLRFKWAGRLDLYAFVVENVR